MIASQLVDKMDKLPKHQSLVYNAAIRTAEYIVCYEGHSRKIIPRNNIHTLHAKQHAFYEQNITHSNRKF